MIRKRVLHVINSLTFGGAEVLLANSLAPGGLQVHTDNYITWFMGDSSLIGRIDKAVQLIPLEYKGKFDLPRALKKLRKIIIDNRISIVHTHLTPSNYYTRLVLPAHVKQVHTVHSTYSMDHTQRTINRFLEKHLFLNRKDCNLIFLSEYNRQDFLRTVKNFRGRAFVLNNFISDEFFGEKTAFYTPGAAEMKVIAVGVLREEKNYAYLLEIFSFLKDHNIRLDVYGGGDKTAYEKIVAEKKLNVRFMGQHDQVHTVFKNYDLFILPSKFEGFGLSIFEAMASGVPVMISNLDSLKSIVGDHAIYFDLDNAEKAAQQIKAIYLYQTDINSMAEKAKMHAEKTVRRDTYIKQLMNIYNSLSKEG